MKPMDMAEALFGSDDDATGKPEGSVDTSAMAAIAAHLAREDAGSAPVSYTHLFAAAVLVTALWKIR